jgi:hypothetical protein
MKQQKSNDGALLQRKTFIKDGVFHTTQKELVTFIKSGPDTSKENLEIIDKISTMILSRADYSDKQRKWIIQKINFILRKNGIPKIDDFRYDTIIVDDNEYDIDDGIFLNDDTVYDFGDDVRSNDCCCNDDDDDCRGCDKITTCEMFFDRFH